MVNKKTEKKGAIELSIGTVVIIVLAMTMLVLGIVLVRNIFTGAIGIADVTDDKVRAQITSLFTEEDSTIVMLTGPDRTVDLVAGGDRVNVNFGVQPGNPVTGSRDLTYKIRIDELSNNNCEELVQGGRRGVEEFFQYTLGDSIYFDRYDSSKLFASIEIAVPDGVPSCTQKVYVDVSGTTTGNNQDFRVGDFFIFEVKQGGIFS